MIAPIPVTVLCHPRHHCSFVSVALKLSMICAQDLRRKLPVTRTLFPWHNTLAVSLTRDLAKQLALGKWSLCRPCHRMASSVFLISMCCSVVISILHLWASQSHCKSRTHFFFCGDVKDFAFPRVSLDAVRNQTASYWRVWIICFFINAPIWWIIVGVLYEFKNKDHSKGMCAKLCFG